MVQIPHVFSRYTSHPLFNITTARVAAALAVVTTLAACFAAYAAVKSLKQSASDSKARSRPTLVAELRITPYTPGSQQLIIRNFGASLARDVLVSFDPQIVLPEDTSELSVPFMLDRYAEPIAVFPPGMELDNIYYGAEVGPGNTYVNREPTPDQITVHITYTNDGGRDTYVDKFPLDVNLLRKRTYAVADTSPHELAKQAAADLAAISSALQRNPIRVATYSGLDFDEHRKRSETEGQVAREALAQRVLTKTAADVEDEL